MQPYTTRKCMICEIAMHWTYETCPLCHRDMCFQCLPRFFNKVTVKRKENAMLSPWLWEGHTYKTRWCAECVTRMLRFRIIENDDWVYYF